MKILPISDLHLEFLDNETSDRLIESLVDADVLVLAGDITTMFVDRNRSIFQKLADKYDAIVYIPGNHEYYRSNPINVHKNLQILSQEFGQLKLLTPENPVTIKNQRFVGGTMWFPDGPYNVIYKSALSDFNMIKDFVPWVYEQNTHFRRIMSATMESTDVVVTHHLPHRTCVSPKYYGDQTNIFFFSDEEKLILDKRPKLWIHGHTHFSSDYKIEETRMVCNPKGYSNENDMFNPKFIVEV